MTGDQPIIHLTLCWDPDRAREVAAHRRLDTDRIVDHICRWNLIGPNPWPYLPQIGTAIKLPPDVAFGGSRAFGRSFVVDEIEMALKVRPGDPVALISATDNFVAHPPHDYMRSLGFSES